MQAIIRAGGKQYKVSTGDVIEVEHVKDGSDSMEFTPLLVIDDKGKTVSAKADLASARVVASVVGASQGPKVDVYKYRNKTGYRRHTGHRQKYTTLQISDIKLDKKSGATKTKTAAPKDAAPKDAAPKTAATKTTAPKNSPPKYSAPKETEETDDGT